MSLRYSSEYSRRITSTEEFKLLTHRGVDVIFEEDRFIVNGSNYYELGDWFTFCDGYMACLGGGR